LLLLLCGGAYALWKVLQDEPAGGGGGTPTTPPVVQTTPVTPPTTPPATTAPPTTPPVTLIEVPNVVGKNGQAADEQLRAAGFTNIKFVNGDNDGTAVQLLQDWTVTAQNPAAGQMVPGDTEIVLTAIKPSGGM